MQAYLAEIEALAAHCSIRENPNFECGLHL